MSNNNHEDGAIECVSIRGTIIDLRDVSPDLRNRYHLACKAVGRADRARDTLKQIGDAILAEQTIKHAPAIRGNHAVAAKLMGFKR